MKRIGSYLVGMAMAAGAVAFLPRKGCSRFRVHPLLTLTERP
jgi:hypothetical protein